jgi:hypothetical protein
LSLKKKKWANPDVVAKRLENLQSGRDEMNLCELPFATLSERSDGRKMLRFEVEDFDHELGQMVCRTLTVKGDPEFGLPTQRDEELYLGLMKYSNDYNGFSDPEVRFSRSALFELMEWPKSACSYSRLTKGMHRLVGVRLSYQKLWRDNRDKQWRDQGAFGLLDSFEFRDSRTVGRSASFCEHSSVFRWGAVLFQSFDSGYLKRIDYGFARSLSATARRLYRYLDKHFHPPRKTRITVDLARLAYQHIGVCPSTELDKARKRLIGPATNELENAGFLKPCMAGAFRKVRRGVWEATFDLDEARFRKTRGEQDDQVGRLIEALSRCGVSSATACSLVARHAVTDIREAIQAMGEQIRSGNRVRNADAWFTAALKNGYKPSATTQRTAKRPELQIFRASRPVG